MEPAMTERLLNDINEEFIRFERKEHPVDFPLLPEIPVARYADQEFWDIEQRHLWPKSWLIAGHIGELPDKGSYRLWNESGVPIVIVRGKDETIRAFYNVCQHRGGPFVLEGEGKLTVLSCKYHGWTYDLEGQLKFVTDEHELPGLDKGKLNLRPLRCELWGNFIFVNRDPDAPSLLKWLGPLAEEFKDFHLDQRHVYAKVEYEMDGNWKVGIESNAEAYHAAIVHPETVHKMLDYRGNAIHLFRNGHSRVLAPYHKAFGKAVFQLLDVDGASDKKTDETPDHVLASTAIRNYVICPNLMISAGAPDSQFPLITYWPQGIGKTKMVVYYTTLKNEDANSTANQEVIKGFDIALEEDRASLAAVQQAYEKGLIKTVKLAYTERRLYHLQEQIDRMIGVEHIPETYRIKPVTQPHIHEPYQS